MKSLFVSQQNLEAWVEQGKATFQDDVLTLPAENVPYKLQPAVRITGLLAGEDQSGLLGKTCTVAELKASGAEHCRDSVILGDTAYECEEGFVCVQAEGETTAAPAEDTSNESKSDTDLLAEFMLKHL